MDRKLLFIYNPKAGKAQIRNKLADVLDVFAKEGYEITIVPTQKREDARRAVAERREGYDLVVCSGGDGTDGGLPSAISRREAPMISAGAYLCRRIWSEPPRQQYRAGTSSAT